MSHSPLALAANSTQFTSSDADVSSNSNKPAGQPDAHVGSAQQPTASSLTNAELAIILRPFLLG